MKKQKLESFPVIGITVRTSNADGHAAKDIPELWNRFHTMNIAAQLAGIVSHDIYSVYTDYEGDYTQSYTTLIGYRVENLDQVPEGLTGMTIGGVDYLKLTAEGNLSEGAVLNAWLEIWNSDIPRAYVSDFEVYGERASDPKNAAVDIYLSIKP